MGQMQIQQATQGDVLSLTLSGTIDEDTVFPEMSGAPQNIRLDLAGIKTINSCGIREWVKWITPLASQKKITLEKCPKVIVDQINMVEGFLPKTAQIDSFYVPYYCDELDEDKILLMKNGEHFKYSDGGEKAIINIPTTLPAEDGKNEFEIDVIEAKYFRFLAA